MSATAVRDKKSEPSQETKTVGMFADEAYWAGLIGARRGQGIARVLRPLVRDALRRMVRETGQDPDQAFAEYVAASRED